MKKILQIGSLISVGLPILAISCNSPFEIKEYVPPVVIKPETSTLNEGVIFTGAGLKPLDKKPVTNHASNGYVKTDATNIDASKIEQLRVLRNQEENLNWHSINDNMIDPMNDFRYAVWKASKGNTEALELLRDFIKSAPFFEYDQLQEKVDSNDLANSNVDITKPSSGSNLPIGITNFAEAARFSMKSFLDQLNPEYLKISFNGTLGGQPHLGTNFEEYGSYEDMQPLVPSTRMMGWAQYRAQQIDWLGRFDDHDWKLTNTLINQEKDPYTKYADKPVIWDGPHFGGENYAPIGQVINETDIPSSVSFVEGWASFWELVLDDRDATGTIGHRSNLLNPDWKTTGWSLSLYDDTQTSGYKVGLNIQFNENQISKEEYEIANKLNWLRINDGHNGDLDLFKMLEVIKSAEQLSYEIRTGIKEILNKETWDKQAVINLLERKLNGSGLSYNQSLVLFDIKDITSTTTEEGLKYLSLLDVKLDSSDIVGGVSEQTKVRDILGSGLVIRTL